MKFYSKRAREALLEGLLLSKSDSLVETFRKSFIKKEEKV